MWDLFSYVVDQMWGPPAPSLCRWDHGHSAFRTGMSEGAWKDPLSHFSSTFFLKWPIITQHLQRSKVNWSFLSFVLLVAGCCLYKPLNVADLASKGLRCMANVSKRCEISRHCTQGGVLLGCQRAVWSLGPGCILAAVKCWAQGDLCS